MPRDPFVELEELLRDERDAIRALDGARVLAYAARKEALLAELSRCGRSVSAETAARLRALLPRFGTYRNSFGACARYSSRRSVRRTFRARYGHRLARREKPADRAHLSVRG